MRKIKAHDIGAGKNQFAEGLFVKTCRTQGGNDFGFLGSRTYKMRWVRVWGGCHSRVDCLGESRL